MIENERARIRDGSAQPILVWDLPVRLFHWLLVLSFAGAYVTADSKTWRDVHVVLGYTVVVLIAFRLVWAVIGTRYARFASFAYGPRAVIDYLRSLATRAPRHYVGHNPAGSVAIYALLALGLATGLTGLTVWNDVGGHAMKELHEGIANTMLSIVFVHIAGVVISSLLHRENLVKAMVTGRKEGSPGEGIRRARLLPALLLVALVSGLWIGVVPRPGIDHAAGVQEHHAQAGAGPSRADDD